MSMSKLIIRNKNNDQQLPMRSVFDRLFTDAWGSAMTDFHDIFTSSFSSMGLQQGKTENGNWSISIDVPGFKEENINIEIQGNSISVKGETKTTHSSRTINKSFTLPEGYDTENITAQLADGVLTLTLVPITPQTQEPKKINISNKNMENK